MQQPYNHNDVREAPAFTTISIKLRLWSHIQYSVYAAENINNEILKRKIYRDFVRFTKCSWVAYTERCKYDDDDDDDALTMLIFESIHLNRFHFKFLWQRKYVFPISAYTLWFLLKIFNKWNSVYCNISMWRVHILGIDSFSYIPITACKTVSKLQFSTNTILKLIW